MKHFGGFIHWLTTNEGENINFFDDEIKSQEANRLHDFLVEHPVIVK